MNDIISLLEAAKQATGSANDSELARKVGVSPSAINNYRRGVSLPNAVVCATLAGLTGEPLARVLGIVGEARAISREEKAVWRKLAASAALLALVVAPALFQQAHAATMHQVQSSTDPATLAAAGAVSLGIMRNEPWYRRVLAWFMRNPCSTVSEGYAWA